MLYPVDLSCIARELTKLMQKMAIVWTLESAPVRSELLSTITAGIIDGEKLHTVTTDGVFEWHK